MSGVINTSNWAKALWPGVNKWYGQAYDEWKPIWPMLFEQNTSRRAWEEDVGTTGFGLASVIPEGEPVSYDTNKQGFTSRYTHVKYGMGFIVTKETYDDDLYDVVAKQRSEALAFSMRQTKEIVGHLVYNRAFSGSYVGGDGVALISASHPNVTGGTWSNKPSVDSDLSEAALEQAVIDISLFKNDRGLQITAKCEDLIIHPNYQFEVHRILKSDGRVGTDSNDTNALNDMGMFRKIVISPYLTDTDAWFIKTNIKNGLKYFQRMGDEFKMENDFDTDNAKFKGVGRYSFGWTDPRGIYACQGA